MMAITSERRSMMTKPLKIILLALTFVLIGLIVVTGLVLEAQLQKSRTDLNQIYTRREDLLNQQQQLSLLVSQMNSTLMDAIQKNTNMTAELAQVTQQQAALQQAAQLQTVIAAQQQTPPPTPAPPPVVVNRVVTRAS